MNVHENFFEGGKEVLKHCLGVFLFLLVGVRRREGVTPSRYLLGTTQLVGLALVIVVRFFLSHDASDSMHTKNKNRTSESEPVYVEPAPEAQLDSSMVCLCKKALQGLKISPQAWEYSQHTDDQRDELQPVDRRPFDVREETYTTVTELDSLASHG